MCTLFSVKGAVFMVIDPLKITYCTLSGRIMTLIILFIGYLTGEVKPDATTLDGRNISILGGRGGSN